MEEIWKDIEGWDGTYQVSNLGRVKRVKTILGFKTEKFLNPSKNKDGYVQVNLSKNGNYKTLKIHRLIAIAFIPNPKCKPNINHINGITFDNRIENLEWCTQKENILHAYRTGLASNNGVKNSKAKLKEHQVLQIRKKRFDGMSLKEISKEFNISVSTVSFICTNRSWSHI